MSNTGNNKNILSSRHQLSLYNSVRELVAKVNRGVLPERQITLAAALSVANREVVKNVNAPVDARIYAAKRAVMAFGSLATKNKITTAALENSDLLAIGHPMSTKQHAMGEDSLRHARALWVAADTSIVSPAMRALVATAHSLEPGSIEREHAFARLFAAGPAVVPITAAVDLEPIVAAFGFGLGGNSRAARSARARMQRRDRKGRFAFMGGGWSFSVKFPDGRHRGVSGKTIGASGVDDVEVDVRGSKYIRDGVYTVPAKQGIAAKAIVPSRLLKDLPEKEVSADQQKYSIDASTLVRKDAPAGWTKVSSQGGLLKYKTADGYVLEVPERKDNSGEPDFTSGGTLRRAVGNKAVADKLSSWDKVEKQALRDQDDYQKYLDSTEGQEALKSGKYDVDVVEEDVPTLQPKGKAPAQGTDVVPLKSVNVNWQTEDGPITKQGLAEWVEEYAPGVSADLLDDGTVKLTGSETNLRNAVDKATDGDYNATDYIMDSAEIAARGEPTAPVLVETGAPKSSEPTGLDIEKMEKAVSGIYDTKYGPGGIEMRDSGGETITVSSEGDEYNDALGDGFRPTGRRVGGQRIESRRYAKPSGNTVDLDQDPNKLLASLGTARNKGDLVRFNYKGVPRVAQPGTSYVNPKNGQRNIRMFDHNIGEERTFAVKDIKPPTPKKPKPEAAKPSAPSVAGEAVDISDALDTYKKMPKTSFEEKTKAAAYLTEEFAKLQRKNNRAKFMYKGKERDVEITNTGQYASKYARAEGNAKLVGFDRNAGGERSFFYNEIEPLTGKPQTSEPPSEAAPSLTEPVDIPSTNVEEIAKVLNDAIPSKSPVRFDYSGKTREFVPERIYTNPKTGKQNTVGFSKTDNEGRTFTLDKMSPPPPLARTSQPKPFPPGFRDSYVDPYSGKTVKLPKDILEEPWAQDTDDFGRWLGTPVGPDFNPLIPEGIGVDSGFERTLPDNEYVDPDTGKVVTIPKGEKVPPGYRPLFPPGYDPDPGFNRAAKEKEKIPSLREIAKDTIPADIRDILYPEPDDDGMVLYSQAIDGAIGDLIEKSLIEPGTPINRLSETDSVAQHERLIKKSILGKEDIAFTYHDKPRIVTPAEVVTNKTGKLQVKGFSRTDGEDRTFNIDKINKPSADTAVRADDIVNMPQAELDEYVDALWPSPKAAAPAELPQRAYPIDTLLPKESSAVRRIDYDENTNEMVVGFKVRDGKGGGTYLYPDVSKDDYRAIADASSVGSAIGKFIKGRKFEKLNEVQALKWLASKFQVKPLPTIDGNPIDEYLGEEPRVVRYLPPMRPEVKDIDDWTTAKLDRFYDDDGNINSVGRDYNKERAATLGRSPELTGEPGDRYELTKLDSEAGYSYGVAYKIVTDKNSKSTALSRDSYGWNTIGTFDNLADAKRAIEKFDDKRASEPDAATTAEEGEERHELVKLDGESGYSYGPLNKIIDKGSAFEAFVRDSYGWRSLGEFDTMQLAKDEITDLEDKIARRDGGPGEPGADDSAARRALSDIFDGAKGKPASEYSDKLPKNSEIIAVAGDGDVLYGRNEDGSYYVADMTVDDDEIKAELIDPSDSDMMTFLKEQFVDSAPGEVPSVFYRGGFVDGEYEKKYLRSLPNPPTGGPGEPGADDSYEEAFDSMFVAPSGAYKPNVFDVYEPVGRTVEQSADYTDDPDVLATKYDTVELAAAASRGIADGSGDAPLDFEAGPEDVPVEAVLEALEKLGIDKESLLAKLYERIAAESNNKAIIDATKKASDEIDRSILNDPDSSEAEKMSIGEAARLNGRLGAPGFTENAFSLISSHNETNPNILSLARDIENEPERTMSAGSAEIISRYLPWAFSNDPLERDAFRAYWGLILLSDGGDGDYWFSSDYEDNFMRNVAKTLGELSDGDINDGGEILEKLFDEYGGFKQFAVGRQRISQGIDDLSAPTAAAALYRLTSAMAAPSDKELQRYIFVDEGTDAFEKYTTVGSEVTFDPRSFSSLDVLSEKPNEAFGTFDGKRRKLIFRVPPGEIDAFDIHNYSWLPGEQEHIGHGPLKIEKVEKVGKLTYAIDVSRAGKPTDVLPQEPAAAPGLPTVKDYGDISSWTRVGRQLGSNTGGTFRDEDGNEYYVKTARSTSHAENEALASAFYKFFNIPASEVGLGVQDNDEVIITPMIPSTAGILQNYIGDAGTTAQLHDGFAIDAWLANYDVAGLEFDNVVVDSNGNAYRIDPGGALMWRAQGKRKDWFGPEVTELDSMRDSNINFASNTLFGEMSAQQVIDSGRKLLDITPSQIDDIVDSVISDPRDKEMLKDILKRRRSSIFEQLGIAEPGSETIDAIPSGPSPSNYVAPVGFEAQDLQPGDVAASDSFVIERIFRDGDTPSGKVSVQGYFPGHESQRKEWNETTTIEVSRGGAIPPKGTKPALHRPKAPRKPSPGAFNGKMAELLKDAKTWEEAAAVIRSTPMVFFDYESTGLPGPERGGKNEPVQIGAVKVVDGKVVDRFSSYMNPEHELSDWSIDNLKQLDGSPVTDDWLKTQISKREAHEAFLAFVGDGPVILGGQYTPFDLEILGRTLNELGLSIDIAGTIDSKDLASGTLPKWNSKTKFGPYQVSPKDGKTRSSYSLGPIAEFLQVQLPDWHRADADAEAAWEITDAMLTRAIDIPDTPKTLLNVDDSYAETQRKLDEYNKEYKQYEEKLAEYVAAKAIAAAWNCGGSGITAAVGPENGPCSVPDIETIIREATPAPIGEIDPDGVTGGSTTNETSMSDALEIDDPRYDGIDTNNPYKDEAFMPTEEQRDIIDAIMQGDDVVVEALAGTGKTSTLLIAGKRKYKEKPTERGVYIAFNKSAQLEAERKFGEAGLTNIEVVTNDAISYRWASQDIKNKMKRLKKNSPLAYYKNFAKEFGITEMEGKTLFEAVNLFKSAVNQYMISADDEIGPQHFNAAGFEGDVPSWMLNIANNIWSDYTSPDGKAKINNTVVTKMWALSRPDLSKLGSGLKSTKDFIFFDEAQDINPVSGKVIIDQTAQTVYVGDENQAIYGFRGGENQLAKVDKTVVRLPLTKSFRFGKNIAAEGNKWLQLLGSPLRIEGAGATDGDVVTPGSLLATADAILVRTNSGGFGAIFDQLGRDRVVGVTKNYRDDLVKLTDSAEYLITGQNRPSEMHEELAPFKNWAEVEKAIANEDIQNKKVEKFAELVDEVGISGLRDLIDKLKLVRGTGNIADTSEEAGEIGDVSPGSTGDVGMGIQYTVTDTGVSLSGNTYMNRDAIKATKRFTYNGSAKTWDAKTKGEEDTFDLLNGLSTSLSGGSNSTKKAVGPIDVMITTVHQAKGLEWPSVAMWTDFFTPRTDKETGELVLPDPTEQKIAYVAVTRAMENLDLGGLDWINSVIQPSAQDDESPFDAPPTGAPAEPPTGGPGEPPTGGPGEPDGPGEDDDFISYANERIVLAIPTTIKERFDKALEDYADLDSLNEKKVKSFRKKVSGAMDAYKVGQYVDAEEMLRDAAELLDGTPFEEPLKSFLIQAADAADAVRASKSTKVAPKTPEAPATPKAPAAEKKLDPEWRPSDVAPPQGATPSGTPAAPDDVLPAEDAPKTAEQEAVEKNKAFRSNATKPADLQQKFDDLAEAVELITGEDGSLKAMYRKRVREAMEKVSAVRKKLNDKSISEQDALNELQQILDEFPEVVSNSAESIDVNFFRDMIQGVLDVLNGQYYWRPTGKGLPPLDAVDPLGRPVGYSRDGNTFLVPGMRVRDKWGFSGTVESYNENDWINVYIRYDIDWRDPAKVKKGSWGPGVGRRSMNPSTLTVLTPETDNDPWIDLPTTPETKKPAAAYVEKQKKDWAKLKAARDYEAAARAAELRGEEAPPMPAGLALMTPSADLVRESKKTKANISSYFNDAYDDKDVADSTNDFALSRNNKIIASDAVITTTDEAGNPLVLMISRQYGPFTGARSLPGGFKDEGESFEAAADREMMEEVGISADQATSRTYLGEVSANDWDPRAYKGVQVGAVAYQVPPNTPLKAGDDATGAEWVSIQDIIKGTVPIAFGHATWLAEAFKGSKYEAPLRALVRASKERNARLISQINAIRAERGLPTFDTPSPELWTPIYPDGDGGSGGDLPKADAPKGAAEIGDEISVPTGNQNSTASRIPDDDILVRLMTEGGSSDENVNFNKKWADHLSQYEVGSSLGDDPLKKVTDVLALLDVSFIDVADPGVLKLLLNNGLMKYEKSDGVEQLETHGSLMNVLNGIAGFTSGRFKTTDSKEEAKKIVEVMQNDTFIANGGGAILDPPVNYGSRPMEKSVAEFWTYFARIMDNPDILSTVAKKSPDETDAEAKVRKENIKTKISSAGALLRALRVADRLEGDYYRVLHFMQDINDTSHPLHYMLNKGQEVTMRPTSWMKNIDDIEGKELSNIFEYDYFAQKDGALGDVLLAISNPRALNAQPLPNDYGEMEVILSGGKYRVIKAETKETNGRPYTRIVLEDVTAEEREAKANTPEGAPASEPANIEDFSRWTAAKPIENVGKFLQKVEDTIQNNENSPYIKFIEKHQDTTSYDDEYFIDAAVYYIGGGSEEINAYLSGLESAMEKDGSGYNGDPKRMDQAIRTLDKLITVMPKLNKDTVVYRGVSRRREDDPIIDALGNLKPGDTFSNASYTSTAFAKEVADNFVGEDDDGGYLLEIVLPKGTRGIYADAVAFVGAEDSEAYSKIGTDDSDLETEFILPRDSTFQVLSRDGKNIKLVLVPKSKVKALEETPEAPEKIEVPLEAPEAPEAKAEFIKNSDFADVLAEYYATAKQAFTEGRLTKKDWDRIQSYFGADSIAVNNFLRSGKRLWLANEKDTIENVIKSIDDIFDVAGVKLPRNVVVFRGIYNADTLFPDGVKPGEVFDDLGYSSASIKSDVARTFTNTDETATILAITVPSGTKMLANNTAIQAGQPKKEKEILLPRGLTFKVTSVIERTKPNKTYPFLPETYREIAVEIVSTPEAKPINKKVDNSQKNIATLGNNVATPDLRIEGRGAAPDHTPPDEEIIEMFLDGLTNPASEFVTRWSENARQFKEGDDPEAEDIANKLNAGMTLNEYDQLAIDDPFLQNLYGGVVIFTTTFAEFQMTTGQNLGDWDAGYKDDWKLSSPSTHVKSLGGRAFWTDMAKYLYSPELLATAELTPAVAFLRAVRAAKTVAQPLARFLKFDATRIDTPEHPFYDLAEVGQEIELRPASWTVADNLTTLEMVFDASVMTSESPETILANDDERDGHVVLRVEGVPALNLSQLSPIPDEKEYVVANGKYVVSGVKKTFTRVQNDLDLFYTEISLKLVASKEETADSKSAELPEEVAPEQLKVAETPDVENNEVRLAARYSIDSFDPRDADTLPEALRQDAGITDPNVYYEYLDKLVELYMSDEKNSAAAAGAFKYALSEAAARGAANLTYSALPSASNDNERYEIERKIRFFDDQAKAMATVTDLLGYWRHAVLTDKSIRGINRKPREGDEFIVQEIGELFIKIGGSGDTWGPLPSYKTIMKNATTGFDMAKTRVLLPNLETASPTGRPAITTANPKPLTTSAFQGIMSLADAISYVKSKKQADGQLGASALIDAGDIEDLNVHVSVTEDDTKEFLEIKFKLTPWAALAQLNAVQESVRLRRESKEESNDLFVPGWKQKTLEVETKVLQDSTHTTVGTPAQGFREGEVYAYESSDGTKISLISAQKQRGKIDIYNTTFDAAPAAYHGQITIKLPIDSTMSDIEKALNTAGVRDVRAATKEDATVVIENKLLSLFKQINDPTINEKSQYARDKMLDEIADSWGVRPDDVVLVPGQHGKINYILPERTARQIKDESGTMSLSHAFSFSYLLADESGKYFAPASPGDSSVPFPDPAATTKTFMGPNSGFPIIPEKAQIESVARGVVDVLRYGLLSTVTRFGAGLGYRGQSHKEDVFTGGADYIFFTPRPEGDISHYARPSHLVSAQLILPAEQVFNRLDLYANRGDEFGRRIPGTDAISGSKPYGYETVVKHGISAALPGATMAIHPKVRDRVLEILKEEKITEINGIAIADLLPELTKFDKIAGQSTGDEAGDIVADEINNVGGNVDAVTLGEVMALLQLTGAPVTYAYAPASSKVVMITRGLNATVDEKDPNPLDLSSFKEDSSGSTLYVLHPNGNLIQLTPGSVAGTGPDAVVVGKNSAKFVENVVKSLVSEKTVKNTGTMTGKSFLTGKASYQSLDYSGATMVDLLFPAGQKDAGLPKTQFKEDGNESKVPKTYDEYYSYLNDFIDRYGYGPGLAAMTTQEKYNHYLKAYEELLPLYISDIGSIVSSDGKSLRAAIVTALLTVRNRILQQDDDAPVSAAAAPSKLLPVDYDEFMLTGNYINVPSSGAVIEDVDGERAGALRDVYYFGITTTTSDGIRPTGTFVEIETNRNGRGGYYLDKGTSVTIDPNTHEIQFSSSGIKYMIRARRPSDGKYSRERAQQDGTR